VIAELAARQHGVVARAQLLAAGLSRSMVETRVGSGQLVVLHRGVYAVGHRHLRREGHWLAAVLAAGPRAVLSHRAAAALHGFRPSAGTAIDVSTTADRRGGRGIRVHSRRVLDADDVTVVDAVPTTTVARTIVDLAATIPQDRLVKAIAEADRLGRFDLRALHAAMRRLKARHDAGHRKLTAALQELAIDAPPFTRSELEDRFLSLVVQRHGLPRPLTNAPVGHFEVDALWRAQRVAVELDGYRDHCDRAAFQRDRDKTNALIAAGYTVLRFTWRDVTQRAGDVASRIAQQLSRAAGSAPPPPAAARRAS
jgi:very-short-patch-repair endonuclease/predicted transcriptional regulator of viral defense system